MKGLTREEKFKKYEDLDRKLIHIEGNYHDDYITSQVTKGDAELQLLYKMFKDSARRHNAKIKKQITKLRNTPTID